MVNQLGADIFSDPIPGMTTMPTYLDSSLYTETGSHWAAPNDYTPSDDH
jgi:hypothetical protein